VELESGGVFDFDTPGSRVFIAAYVARVRERGCDLCGVVGEMRRCNDCALSAFVIGCFHGSADIQPSAHDSADTCGNCERIRDLTAIAEREAA